MANDENKIILEFPATNVEIEFGETITFDNISGFLNSDRVTYNGESLTEEIAHLENDKADTTYVDEQLELKADKATTYTKTQSDNRYLGKTNPSGTGYFSLNRRGSTGDYSVSVGWHNEANAQSSFAEGEGNTSSGYASHSEGYGNTASGLMAHAEGVTTESSGYASHSEGVGTIANHIGQHVFGTYNVADTSTAEPTAKGNYIEIVGNGTDDDRRRNARTLDWRGNETLMGNLTYNGDKSLTSEISRLDGKIDNLPSPMIFKGTLGVGGTIQTLPTASASNEGYTYKVITDGTYAGQTAKVGDVFTSNGSEWVLIPSGDEDNDTWRAIKVEGVEVLGNGISSGAVDFVGSENIEVEFDSNGNKVGVKTKNIYTKTQTDEAIATAIESKADQNDVETITREVDEISDLLIGDNSINLVRNAPYYWNVETSKAIMTNLPASNWNAYNAIPVSEGDVCRVKACQGNTLKTRIWVFTDDELNIISMAESHPDWTYHEEDVVVPVGGTKLLVTSTASASGAVSPFAWVTIKSVKKEILRCVPQSLSSEEKEIARNNINAASIEDVFSKVLITNYSFTNEHYWNVEGEKAVNTPLAQSNWLASTVIEVSEGQKFVITGCQGATHKTRIWVLTDDDMNIVAMAYDHYSQSEQIDTESFIVPSGATKLVLTTRTNAGYPYAWLYRIKSALEILLEKPLTGKYLSLLGDSISAYAGTIPEGNDAYYTGSNSGVSSSYQMWWSVLCNKTGMIPLVINGWSGSGVTQLEDSAHISKVPMSDDSRCSNLGVGTKTPDIILIAGGVNDYTYAMSAQSEPLDWNGKTTPIIGNSFSEAYACMIKKLQTNYPNAIIVALSTWFTMRGTDNGYTLTHTVGSNVYTQADYNKAIENVAKQMHIPFIDVSNIGFNRNNFYPTYAVDSSTIPTHPNASGHYVMGMAIAEKMPCVVKGYLG